MTTTDAASITKTMQVSVNKVAKKLSRVMELFTIYRVLPNKNIEVQVMIGYSYALAQQAILDEMKLQMKNESENMQKKYDQFLNPETYQSGTIQNVNEDNQ
jgi:transcription initiation factor IIE alpha subunit